MQPRIDGDEVEMVGDDATLAAGAEPSLPIHGPLLRFDAGRSECLIW